MKHIINWAGGLMFVVLLFGVIHMANIDMEAADTLNGINAEMDKAESRMQRAAHALCVAELGPGTVALWTREGDLVCRPAEVVAGVAK